MGRYKEILIGDALFLAGYLFCLITSYIVPALMNVAEATLGDIVSGIIWFGTILIWILCMPIIPIGVLVHGMTKTEDHENKYMQGIAGILWFIFGLLLSIYTYYMVDPLVTSLATYTILQILLYISLISVWIFNVLIIPAYLIMKSRS